MVETDFYHDIKTSPKLNKDLKNLPYALEAFSVPIEEVGKACADIAAQEPGKDTGKIYSLLRGKRLLRGIGMADHSLGAALYALKAVKIAGKSVDVERKWQTEQLPSEIKELILTTMSLK